MPKDESRRARMVVEEITETLEPVKEKIEELQTLTQDISQSVTKSENLEEEIVSAVEDIKVPEEPVVHVMHQEETPPVVPPETPFMPQDDTMPQIKSGNGANPLVILIPGIFLLGALLGGIYFYQKGIGGSPTATVEPTESTVIANATPIPVATPATTLVLSKYPVKIMNGSGTPGEAGKVKDILTTGGFTVSSTGNATSYDFTKSVIKAKAEVPAAFVTQLSTLMGKTYVMDVSQTLATSSADSVQIIVGSTKVK